MRKSWFPLIAAGIAAQVASPAAAQYGGRYGSGQRAPAPPGVGRDLGQINDRIGDGRHSGQLSRKEARALRRESTLIDGMQQRYGSDGLSASEQAELETRAAVLRDAVNNRRTQSRK